LAAVYCRTGRQRPPFFAARPNDYNARRIREGL
jgi:hypothetical protein